MDSWLRTLDRSPGAALLILAIAVVLLGWMVVAASLRSRRFGHRWERLLQGSEGASLEAMLEAHFADRQALIDRVKDAEERLEALERKMRSSKRYVGLTNYDAFEDVGGRQSFSMALYDEEGNGAVVTSQVGREGCRVYGKALVHGKADRHLSAEEESAIEAASSARARPRISP